MIALYKMRYHGVAGFGGGVVYIGRGKILGMDISEARYDGSYTDQGGRVRGTVTLTSGGGALVTGQQMPAGNQLQIAIDWPSNFVGQNLPVSVGGQPVQVAITKIGDVP
jgi:hypothetical protein